MSSGQHPDPDHIDHGEDLWGVGTAGCRKAKADCRSRGIECEGICKTDNSVCGNYDAWAEQGDELLDAGRCSSQENNHPEDPDRIGGGCLSQVVGIKTALWGLERSAT